MASTKRIIRNALLEVIVSDRATFDQRIKAARMLTKLLDLAKPGNSRRCSAKKNVQGTTIDRILSGMTE